MADEGFEAFEATLKKAVAAFRDAEVPTLLGGSLAIWARGGPETRHDLDFMVKPEDAERALQALVDVGMRPQRPPEGWLFKAWDGDVLVDLIFHLRGLPVDDALFERAEPLAVLSITVPVMGLEDVLVAKLLSLDEQGDLDYAPVLAMARALRERIDWETLRERTGDSPYAKAFFTLIEELGVLYETPRASRAASSASRS
jgi:hypothetical protein